jgi:hypothetical protein
MFIRAWIHLVDRSVADPDEHVIVVQGRDALLLHAYGLTSLFDGEGIEGDRKINHLNKG